MVGTSDKGKPFGFSGELGMLSTVIPMSAATEVDSGFSRGINSAMTAPLGAGATRPNPLSSPTERSGGGTRTSRHNRHFLSGLHDLSLRAQRSNLAVAVCVREADRLSTGWVSPGGCESLESVT